MDRIDESYDYWKDAKDFSVSNLPDDFEEKLQKHLVKQQYNRNESHLFISFLIEQVKLKGSVAIIKTYSS